MWSHGNFYWNELMTRDAEAAKRFYAATLGWTFEAFPVENSTYWVAKDGETPVAGIFTLNGPEFENVPQSWFAYVAVDDVDARGRKLEKAGGKILRGPYDVPDVGRILIVQDNAGIRLGFMTPVGEL